MKKQHPKYSQYNYQSRVRTIFMKRRI